MDLKSMTAIQAAKNVFGASAAISGVAAALIPLKWSDYASLALQAALIAGAVVAVMSGLMWAGGRLARRLDEQQAPIVASLGEAKNEHDFRKVYAYASARFGRKVSKVPIIRAWSAKYPGCFGIVTVERQRRHRRIVDMDGYYAALPLTAKAAADIRSGRRGISDVQASEICAPGRQVAAIYIGAIAANSGEGKAMAVQGLKALMSKMSCGNDCEVLARPVTMDGLKLARHFEMTPVQVENEDMGVVHSALVSQLLEGLRSKRAKARTRDGF